MTHSSRLSRMAEYTPLIICVYFAAQILIRLLISPSLGKDEAEQVLLAQELAWGYGSQPPLYTWLTIAVFAVFGDGIFALALLKNLLLAGTYLLTFLLIRSVTGNPLQAALGTAGLLLLPQIAWESQRALTHSVLVVFAVALFTYALLQILQHRRSTGYLLLGVAFAVGSLAKFNFPIVALALLFAALSMPEFRPAIINRGMALAAAASGLLLWKPALWLLANKEATLSRADKLTMWQVDDRLANYAAGTWGLFKGVLLFVVLLAVVYAVALIGSKRTEGRAAPTERYDVLLARAILIALGFCLAMIIIFQVTEMKDRWLQPILYLAPIAAALWAFPRLQGWRVGAMLAVSGLCAVLVMVMLPLRTLGGPKIDRINPLNSPYAALTEQIREAGFRDGAVLASFNLLGGNLRLQFPEASVVTPEYPNFPLPRDRAMLLVWEATRYAPMPGNLIELYQRVTGEPLATPQPRYIDASMLYSDRHRMKLGYLLFPPASAMAGH